MRLPAEVRRALEELLAASGGDGGVRSVEPLGGGSIHAAARVGTGGDPLFVKWNEGEAARGFGAEARALAALRAAVESDGLLAVPRVIDSHEPAGDGVGWLALEFLPPSTPAPDHAQRLGTGLARLHGQAGEAFGWSEENLIGSLPQANPRTRRWADFWRDARLGPQLARARDSGWFAAREGRTLDAVLDRTAEALAPVAHEPPSLLHGDLWGGNVHAGPDGRPVLVDPATYHGHREVDLAMSELFGGFPEGFLDAYQEAWPLVEGYREVRRPLYQLYYLLVHVNLFGGGYIAGTMRAAGAVLAGAAA